MYVNGVLDNQMTLSPYSAGLFKKTIRLKNSGFYRNLTQNLNIGGSNSQGKQSEFYAGEMDEIRIWNVARNQSEIQRFMECHLVGDEEGLGTNNLSSFYSLSSRLLHFRRDFRVQHSRQEQCRQQLQLRRSYQC
jgi:hypothetical protein